MKSVEDEDDLFTTLDASVAGAVRKDVDLRTLSRWQIGGRARFVVEPTNRTEVSSVLRIMKERTEPFCIIGGGSNVLFDSQGFDGVILVIGPHLSQMSINGNTVWAQAGISVPTLARAVGQSGLSGIEHTVGIPGTLGGLVLMNGGSQRKGIGDHVESVLCAGQSGELVELSAESCEFSYRQSRLQREKLVVLEVVMRLAPDNARTITQEMDMIVESRARRFPEDLASCGSTFLSNPKMYDAVGAPGHAIEAAGLKGMRRGDAQISPQHANFFVNLGNASSDDVLWLIALARNTVEQKTGYLMDCEVRYVERGGQVRPAHEKAVELWGTDLVLS